MTNQKTPAVVPAVWTEGKPPRRRVWALVTDGRLCDVAQWDPGFGKWSDSTVTHPTHWAPIPPPPNHPWGTSWSILYATDVDAREDERWR